MKTAKLTLFLHIVLFLPMKNAVSQTPVKIYTPIAETKTPVKPSYDIDKNWCALPWVKDMADSLPKNAAFKDGQSTAQADVFFIYPTIYTYQPQNEYVWNADVNDSFLNDRIDGSTILNQCTAFNGSCKVYAPRYRQAHYAVFTTDDPNNKKVAMDIAYEDVKTAFEYYLKNWNKGRPIVIASHSQGTIHAGRLLKEFFDGKPLQNQLVEAYLVGIATPADYFDNIKLSTEPAKVGGFVSWNTFQKGYTPDYYNNGLNKAVSINPLNWSDNENWVSRKSNAGGIGLGYKFVDKLLGAQNHDGMLWVQKPRIFGAIFVRTKIWHKADINFFWNNIRENVALRLENFMKINNEK